MLQCETVAGVENLPALCQELPRPGLIMISTGDLSASMGLRGAYTPEVETLVGRAAAVCRAYGVPFGTPEVSAENVAQRINDGHQILMFGAERDCSTLLRGLAHAGRSDA